MSIRHALDMPSGNADGVTWLTESRHIYRQCVGHAVGDADGAAWLVCSHGCWYQMAASDCEALLLPELLELASHCDRERWESLSLGVYTHMCVDTRIDMRMDMCICVCMDMCVGMCIDMCIDIPIGGPLPSPLSLGYICL